MDAAELAMPPRADQAAELVIIESTGMFFVDEYSYQRASNDLRLILSLDAGDSSRPGFVPEFAPGLLLSFDDETRQRVRDGTYHDWDCLNQSYHGDITYRGSSFATITFPSIDVRWLIPDYQALPGVTNVSLNLVGTAAICGGGADLCLEVVDGGTFAWIAIFEDLQCQRTYFRLHSEADGGQSVARWRDGGSPTRWFEESPACASRLWGNP